MNLPRLATLFLLPLLACAAPVATTQPVFQIDRPSPTADKPQSKLWFAGGSWWALLPGAQSPTLWQRTATGWTEHSALREKLAGSPGRADVWFDYDGVTAACVEGATLAVLRLTPVGSPPTTWQPERLAQWTLPSAPPIETVTLGRDATGRWWLTAPVSQPLAPDQPRPAHGPDRDIVVWTSIDARTWQRLEPLARGVNGDDICTITAAPDGIGVTWSDQNRDHVAFVRHRNTAAPETWEPLELIAKGGKTADDHLHAAASPDGTLWLATKNSLDARGEPQLVLRIRPPAGPWQNLSYAPRLAGLEPSRPVIVAAPRPDLLLLGHTIYDRTDPFHGRIEFGAIDRTDPHVIPAPVAVIAPDPALRSRVNDPTTPKAPFPADAPWIILASDAQGRVFEADLRPLAPSLVPTREKLTAALAGDFRTAAAQPPARHRGPLMRDLAPLILQQARYLVSELRPWAGDATTALLPLARRTPSSESGIRPNAHTAKGLALLARLVPAAEFPAEFSPTVARDRALALIRYLIRTHGASGEACADGKPWRNQWQSAYWAALTGEACWLLWDDLTPAERWLAGRMICDEADRFVGVTPPTNLRKDSKAEENAWNSQIVSLAFSMFPAHPRHALWRETAVHWIATSFARTADLTRTDIVDGKPLREWLTAANIFDDFTLENHSRIHPDYMACTYLLTSQIPLYAWGGHAPPTALALNRAAINAALQRLATPDGSVLYPNGQDWGLHRNVDWLEYHAGLAIVDQDPCAAALLRQSLDAVRRMAARQPTGSVYLPDETKLASDQAMVLEYLAHTYALMAQLGEGPAPLSADALATALAGRHVFPDGRVGVLRTRNSIATFSWGAQVMGTVLPLQPDLLLTPEPRGLIGYVGVSGAAREIPVVREISLAPLADALGLTGVLSRGDGAVEQRFGFLALRDGRTVYVDTLRLTGPVRPHLLDLGTLGVLNDLHWPYHDGTRTLTHAGGTQTFAAANATRDDPVFLDTRWLNLDDRLGLVRLAASGPACYVPAPTSAAGRLEQRLHLNALPAAALARASTTVPLAHGVFIFYPHRTAAETAALAARSTLLSAPGEPLVHLRLDDATEVIIDLTYLRISVEVIAKN